MYIGIGHYQDIRNIISVLFSLNFHIYQTAWSCYTQFNDIEMKNVSLSNDQSAFDCLIWSGIEKIHENKHL